MKLRLLLAACVALAACSSSPPEELPPPQLPQRVGVDPIVAARAEGVAFRAVGPAFVLHIYREDRIVLMLNDGATEESFPKPEPLLPRWNGEIYETENERHRLSIMVRRDRPCPTQPGEHLVVLRYDEAELTGCGRDL